MQLNRVTQARVRLDDVSSERTAHHGCIGVRPRASAPDPNRAVRESAACRRRRATNRLNGGHREHPHSARRSSSGSHSNTGGLSESHLRMPSLSIRGIQLQFDVLLVRRSDPYASSFQRDRHHPSEPETRSLYPLISRSGPNSNVHAGYFSRQLTDK